jgi:hypothetical protein
LQQSRCPDGQVVFGFHAWGGQSVAENLAVFAHSKAYRIAPVQQAEHRLQLVVAIWAAASDLQEQIQLGRRRPG